METLRFPGVGDAPESQAGMLRHFAWLLDGPDRKAFDTLVQAMVKITQGAIVAQMMLTDGSAKDTTGAVAHGSAAGSKKANGGCASSSSSASSAHTSSERARG